MSIRQTRFPELGYEEQGTGNWRIIDTNSGSAIGPQYKSKTELLADLDRYARFYGCYGPDIAEQETGIRLVNACYEERLKELRELTDKIHLDSIECFSRKDNKDYGEYEAGRANAYADAAIQLRAILNKGTITVL